MSLPSMYFVGGGGGIDARLPVAAVRRIVDRLQGVDLGGRQARLGGQLFVRADGRRQVLLHQSQFSLRALEVDGCRTDCRRGVFERDLRWESTAVEQDARFELRHECWNVEARQ